MQNLSMVLLNDLFIFHVLKSLFGSAIVLVVSESSSSCIT